MVNLLACKFTLPGYASAALHQPFHRQGMSLRVLVPIPSNHGLDYFVSPRTFPAGTRSNLNHRISRKLLTKLVCISRIFKFRHVLQIIKVPCIFLFMIPILFGLFEIGPKQRFYRWNLSKSFVSYYRVCAYTRTRGCVRSHTPAHMTRSHTRAPDAYAFLIFLI